MKTVREYEKRRKRRTVVVRRNSKRNRKKRLKRLYITKLGKALRENQIENTPRLRPIT